MMVAWTLVVAEGELRSGWILDVHMLNRKQTEVAADELDVGVGQREESLLNSRLGLSNLKSGVDIYWNVKANKKQGCV